MNEEQKQTWIRTDEGLVSQKAIQEADLKYAAKRSRFRGKVAVIFGSLLVLSLLVNVFFVTSLFFSGIQPSFLWNKEAREQLQKLGKLRVIQDIIAKNYYLEVEDGQLWENLISGAVRGVGSPYTRYMSKEEAELLRQSVNGEYYGIGATVHQDEKTKEISLPLINPGSPAEEAGLRNGDIVLAVDDQPIANFANPHELAAVVRGPVNTQVRLKIKRPSEGNAEMEFTITRGPIKTVSAMGRMLSEAEGVGYLRMREFTKTLPEQTFQALQTLVDAGAQKVIIDLRNNPGGDAQAMVEILDALLPEGEIATIQGRYNGTNYEEKWESNEEMIFPEDLQFVILVNRYSASASEFFSGVLRDRGRAILIGEKTYGKGSATQTYRLGDGSALNVTTFQYILPNGEALEGEGLHPEIESVLADEFVDYNPELLPPEQDVQLQRALQYIKSGE